MTISCHREQKITTIPAIQKYLLYLIINPKQYFHDNELFVLVKSYSDPEDTPAWFFGEK